MWGGVYGGMGGGIRWVVCWCYTVVCGGVVNGGMCGGIRWYLAIGLRVVNFGSS